MTLRRATATDLPLLDAIYRRAFPLRWWQLPVVERWLRQRQLAIEVAANANVYVLENTAGDVVGSVVLRRVGAQAFEVNNFCMRHDADLGPFAWANFVLRAIVDCSPGLPADLYWNSDKAGFAKACDRTARRLGLTVRLASCDQPKRRHFCLERICRVDSMKRAA